MFDLAIKNAKVYLNSEFSQANVYIKDGRFQIIGEQDLEAKEVFDAEGKKVIPGIIDPHVHFELNVGKYTSADDFESGSKAGLYGGVTTFIDFLDPVYKGSEVAQAFEQRKALASKSWSNYSFHACAANPKGETAQIVEAALEAQLPSVKIFTAYSDSNRRTYDPEIKEFMKHSAESGFTLLIHAEDEDHITLSPDFTPADLSKSRPVESELSMMRKLFSYAKKMGGRTYIVHTTCGESLELLKTMPEIANKHIYLESCPQYFYLDDSAFMGEDGFRYVLAPPLRLKSQQERLKTEMPVLWSIGTDHCPFMLAEKKQPQLYPSPFGIGGIEHSFPLMYSLFGDAIIDKMTKNPAELFHLAPRKGVIAEDADADFFIFNDSAPEIIGKGHTRCDYNLYEGQEVVGSVETTVIAGKIRMNLGKLIPGKGEFLAREVDREAN
jgi:dihydropyrimidinase